MRYSNCCNSSKHWLMGITLVPVEIGHIQQCKQVGNMMWSKSKPRSNLHHRSTRRSNWELHSKDEKFSALACSNNQIMAAIRVDKVNSHGCPNYLNKCRFDLSKDYNSQPSGRWLHSCMMPSSRHNMNSSC